MSSSNSKQRVEIDDKVFGHPVIGSLTGRTMSTPDADKPRLVEVAIMRTDNVEGLVWVPEADTAALSYEVTVLCVQDSHLSPTDAVLSTIEWLRSPMVGGITFTVFCPDDKVTYTIEAEQDGDEWHAAVTHAAAPTSGGMPKHRPCPELIPTKETT